MGVYSTDPHVVGPFSALMYASAEDPLQAPQDTRLPEGPTADPAPEEGLRRAWSPSTWHKGASQVLVELKGTELKWRRGS